MELTGPLSKSTFTTDETNTDGSTFHCEKFPRDAFILSVLKWNKAIVKFSKADKLYVVDWSKVSEPRDGRDVQRGVHDSLSVEPDNGKAGKQHIPDYLIFWKHKKKCLEQVYNMCQSPHEIIPINTNATLKINSRDLRSRFDLNKFFKSKSRDTPWDLGGVNAS